ncbi:MAG: hypothetical protein EAS51_06155 [Microbacteriaceae bacterium]|nr:MAG: hypothetical protein EAS51_06155 [Microbacteriaceae bacterium]
MAFIFTRDLMKKRASTRHRGSATRWSASGLCSWNEELPIDSEEEIVDSTNVRLLRKLLRVFQRTTIVSDETLRVRFNTEFATVESQLMPLLVQYGVVEKRKWRGSGQQHAWVLAVGLDDFLAAEGTDAPHGETWRALQASG